MDKLGLIKSILFRFQEETLRHNPESKSKTWSVVPYSKLWNAAEKTSELCLKYDFNPTVLVLSRFHYLNAWAVQKFKVKSLPVALLHSRQVKECYDKYVAHLSATYHKQYSTKHDLTELDTIFMQDASVRRKHLKLKPEALLANYKWLSAIYLASDLDFVLMHEKGDLDSSLIPEDVHCYWERMEKSQYFLENVIKLRQQAERIVLEEV